MNGVETWGPAKAWSEFHPSREGWIVSPLAPLFIAGDEFPEATLPDCGEVGPSGQPPDEFPVCDGKDGNICCVCVENCRFYSSLTFCGSPQDCENRNNPFIWHEPDPELIPHSKWRGDALLWCNMPAAEITIVESGAPNQVINGENYGDYLPREGEDTG